MLYVPLKFVFPSGNRLTDWVTKCLKVTKRTPDIYVSCLSLTWISALVESLWGCLVLIVLFLAIWGFMLQGCHLWHLYILCTISPSLTSSTIIIICSVKIPSLLQSNYHQFLSFSLHNGCQETLRAPVQKLALDPQSPDWDNVCRLTVEEKEKKKTTVSGCADEKVGLGWQTLISSFAFQLLWELRDKV